MFTHRKFRRIYPGGHHDAAARCFSLHTPLFYSRCRFLSAPPFPDCSTLSCLRIYRPPLCCRITPTATRSQAARRRSRGKLAGALARQELSPWEKARFFVQYAPTLYEAFAQAKLELTLKAIQVTLGGPRRAAAPPGSAPVAAGTIGG
jgi:predicted amidophosphoribosyltransferase